jgi:hypothetical protein
MPLLCQTLQASPASRLLSTDGFNRNVVAQIAKVGLISANPSAAQLSSSSADSIREGGAAGQRRRDRELMRRGSRAIISGKYTSPFRWRRTYKEVITVLERSRLTSSSRDRSRSRICPHRRNRPAPSRSVPPCHITMTSLLTFSTCIACPHCEHRV